MADTGSISGQIINIRNNLPIANATVQATGPTNESTTTDPNGNFKLGNLTPGNNYALDVSAADFNTARYEDIVVIATIDTDLAKLALEPSD